MKSSRGREWLVLNFGTLRALRVWPRIANLFIVLETLPISGEIGREAGRYLHSYSKSHAVELGDAFIAATARVTGMSLWTLNKKHYPMKDIQFYSSPR